jgi:hypothetical protein
MTLNDLSLHCSGHIPQVYNCALFQNKSTTLGPMSLSFKTNINYILLKLEDSIFTQYCAISKYSR